MLNELEVAIFSYNRGKYLKNCIESVVENLPSVKITIFDDHSDDQETIEYLSSLGDSVVVGNDDSDSRHGNLYRNMQLALEQSSKRFLLLLQDDTQVVRRVDEQDMHAIGTIFSDPDIAFLRPQFMKLGDGERNVSLLAASSEVRAYIPKLEFEEGTFGHSYCDVVLCDVPKLKKVAWKFLEGERANQIQAHGIFKYMPFMADSFIFYCPEVPCYRNKKLFLASRIVQNKLQGKLSRFMALSEEENANFIKRDINIWPIAETFLETNNKDVVKPFVYQDYNKSLLLQNIYRLERGVYKVERLLKKDRG